MQASATFSRAPSVVARQCTPCEMMRCDGLVRRGVMVRCGGDEEVVRYGGTKEEMVRERLA